MADILTIRSINCTQVILQHDNFHTKIYNSKIHNLYTVYHAEKGWPLIYLYMYIYV